MAVSTVRLEALRDAVIEQATEACAGGGPHDDDLVKAVCAYLIACGDEELAQDIAVGAGLVLAA